MKIKDLIAELQKHDPEMQVIRNGYEGGVEFVSHLHCYEVALDVNTEWWYGKHEIVHPELDIYNDYKDHQKTQAVLIT
jgi:hypothetical protein